MLKSEISRKKLFDIFTLSLYPDYSYNFDGPEGRRVLFVENKAKSVIIQFEEGMDCLDLNLKSDKNCINSEYKKENRYIHQLRKNCLTDFAFFHFEFVDKKGETALLAGQLCAKKSYTWSECDVEPVLVEMLNSIELADGNESVTSETVTKNKKCKSFVFTED